jgi:Holliday junction resolvase
MPKTGNEKHEVRLMEKIKELELDGWRVVNLHGKSPDAIAVKNGKIVAVEILKKIKTERKNPEIAKKKGKFKWSFAGGFTLASKRSNYDMFDEVIFGFYK